MPKCLCILESVFLYPSISIPWCWYLPLFVGVQKDYIEQCLCLSICIYLGVFVFPVSICPCGYIFQYLCFLVSVQCRVWMCFNDSLSQSLCTSVCVTQCLCVLQCLCVSLTEYACICASQSMRLVLLSIHTNACFPVSVPPINYMFQCYTFPDNYVSQCLCVLVSL